MESKIIYSLSLFLENKLSEEQLSKVQEFFAKRGHWDSCI